MVEHDGGWFGPNPDPRYYDASLNPASLQSPEQRLAEALIRSLGMDIGLPTCIRATQTLRSTTGCRLSQKFRDLRIMSTNHNI